MSNRTWTVIMLLAAVAAISQKERQNSRERFAQLSFNRGVAFKISASELNSVEELVRQTRQVSELHEIAARDVFYALSGVAEKELNEITKIGDAGTKEHRLLKLLENIVAFSEVASPNYHSSNFAMILLNVPVAEADGATKIQVRLDFRNIFLRISSKDALDKILDLLTQHGAITEQDSAELKAEWSKPVNKVLREEANKSAFQNWQEFRAARMAAAFAPSFNGVA